MASKSQRREWTPREDDLATFLFRTPATANLIYSVSQTWPLPFASLDFTQRRLRRLCDGGWVSRSEYPAASRFEGSGRQYYYKLTLTGYRRWQGDDSLQPLTKRFFDRLIDPSAHLVVKSQFLARLTIAAWRRGVAIEQDQPENTFAVSVGDVTIWPDHGLTLVGQYGRRFPHFFEFDRSTETLCSDLQLKSTWKEKNIAYDGYQNELGKHDRFRVVPVTSESRQRLTNILHSFAQQTSVPNRQLYVGVYLPDFLACDDAICDPICGDHSRSDIAMIPEGVLQSPPRPPVDLSKVFALPAVA